MATDATFVTNIDLSNLEIRNVKAQVLAADPSGVEGKFIYNSTDKQFKFYNGTAWVTGGGAPLANLSGQAASYGQAAANGSASSAARSDHYHALPAHDAAAHSAIPLSALSAPTVAVAMNGQKITGLAAATANGDAVRYEQLTAKADVGQSFYLGTTQIAINRSSGAIALTGITSIDGSAASATSAANTGITDDTTTNATFYPTFVGTASGNQPNKVSSTKLAFNPSTGLLTATGFSGSGANLTNLPAGQLSGTVPSSVLGNSTLYIGTTAVALNRSSGSMSLAGISGLTMSGNIAMGSNKITGLADGVATSDAATVGQVQAATAGLDVKQSVRLATTGEINVLGITGTYAVDGVTPSIGDRILVKDEESDNSRNGIYIVNAGAWTRATDFDTSAKASPNSFVFVEEGATNADSGWVLTTNGPIVLGTTALNFTQFTGAGQITAGAGLTKTGSTINVGAGTGISVAADTVAVDTNIVARKAAADLTTSATSYVITHNLNTRDVQVTVRQINSPYGVVYTSWEATSVNTITVYFATAPAANTYRVSVQG